MLIYGSGSVVNGQAVETGRYLVGGITLPLYIEDNGDLESAIPSSSRSGALVMQQLPKTYKHKYKQKI